MPMHIVKQGEHLSRIANESGFGDPVVIWDAPENADLRQKRRNPDALMPGDQLFVPERQTKEESGSTDQRHRFRLRGGRLVLRIRLLGFDSQPLPDTPCELHVDGNAFPLRTDADGRIEHWIPKPAEDAHLVFNDPQLPFDLIVPIRIGHLDPIEESSGQRSRLANLGYISVGDRQGDAEHGEEYADQPLAHAVEEFQCDHGLAVDGICGPKTQAKLEEIYGC